MFFWDYKCDDDPNAFFGEVGGCHEILQNYKCGQRLPALDEMFPFTTATLVMDICVGSCGQCPLDWGNLFPWFFLSTYS